MINALIIAALLVLANGQAARAPGPGDGAQSGHGPEARATTTLDCARCHQNKSMQPALQNAQGVPRSLYIDPAAFSQSWHVKLGKKTDCVSCHKDITTYPHRRAARLRCADCHNDEHKPLFKQIEAALRQSVHARLECIDCHDVHRNKPAAEMSLTEKNAGCRKCHLNGLAGPNATSAPVPIAALHSWHPQAALHLDRMACIVCHTDLGPAGPSDKHLIRDKSRATRDCRTCHAGDSKIAQYLIDVGPAPAGDQAPAELLQRIYLVGGTRNKWIEIIGGSLVILVMIGVGGHAAGRLIFWRRRAGRGNA